MEVEENGFVYKDIHITQQYFYGAYIEYHARYRFTSIEWGQLIQHLCASKQENHLIDWYSYPWRMKFVAAIDRIERKLTLNHCFKGKSQPRIYFPSNDDVWNMIINAHVVKIYPIETKESVKACKTLRYDMEPVTPDMKYKLKVMKVPSSDRIHSYITNGYEYYCYNSWLDDAFPIVLLRGSFP